MSKPIADIHLPVGELTLAAIGLLEQLGAAVRKHGLHRVADGGGGGYWHEAGLELVEHGILELAPAHAQATQEGCFRFTAHGWVWFEREFPKESNES